MGPNRLFPYRQPAPPEPTTEEKIRDAALTSCAQDGIAATSFAKVAAAAGISVGAVQHHFRTKAELIDAVDQHVLRVLSDGLDATPLPGPPSEALEEAGRRLTRMMAANPREMDYLGRALVEGEAGSVIGQVIFDGLTRISEAQGEQFLERGAARDDLDWAWAILNPIILRVGPIILRPYIERYLKRSFYDQDQLERWESSVKSLLQHGTFEHQARVERGSSEPLFP
ncbi:TetR/AcrR family transcriptional regulator [Mycobacterium sp. 852002-40037_SCH5390672]|uniref:TetR/AcrR family transcriptional regulator n=1 Tax=Mycobacterium sp. 852002-40037_SCH5390672 TaxID=1834089 RepID=UPI00080594BB|nr:TetR/AcrR family transcriptional regulator [Mycobacterium sp. 852002-40037_SCH5390672]OBB98552.1 TetR family transcriptional regulator [Mycobacterium sp. 852002-40037_SCH5390672]